MGRTVDLRSDTLSLPTAAMRQALYDAVLGDDQYGEDPKTNRLESMAAEKVGKEAALLVLSGTMGNLVAAITHSHPGDEVILDVNSHFYNAEVGGLARVAGLMSRPLDAGGDGLDPLEVERVIRPALSSHRPKTGLIVIENTSNRGGGTIVPLARLVALAEVARRHHIPIHMDGARVFNAAVALQVDVREITQYVDSVQFCLTKGLSAPLGSILAGTRAFIDRARRTRQMLGGGMRQAGIIAAAGIVALETMIDRLAEDHANAWALAQGASRLDGLGVDLSTVHTNMVYIDVAGLGIEGTEAIQLLEKHGVRVLATGPTVLRFVTYQGIRREDIDYTLEALRDIVRVQQSRRAAMVEPTTSGHRLA